MHLGPVATRLGIAIVLPPGPWAVARQGGGIMSYTLLFVASALVMVVLELLPSVGAYRKFRGDRIISCPENHQPAAMRVAAAKAAIQATIGTPHLQLWQDHRME